MSELKLSASEALYGFVGWLTTRSARTVMSLRDNASPIAELVATFCRENELEPTRERWSLLLKHPVEVEDAEPVACEAPATNEFVAKAFDSAAFDSVASLRARLLHAATSLAACRDPSAIGFVDAFLRLEGK